MLVREVLGFYYNRRGLWNGLYYNPVEHGVRMKEIN